MKSKSSLLLKVTQLTFCFLICLTGSQLKAQNTYTATNLRVTDTLTSNNVIRAESITATDTVRAKDHVVMEQDLEVQGNVFITGNLTSPVTSTATLGRIKAVSDIQTGGSFIFNDPNLGMRVFTSNNSINSGSVIHVGPVGTSPDPPLPCSLPNANPWFYMSGGYISKSVNGQVNASTSMYTAPWNGSGFIEAEGTNDQGINKTALLLNYFCGNDVGICLNTGLANGGGKVKVGNFLSAARHVEIGDINPNNSPANNIALEMNVNTGQAIKVKTFNQALSMFEIQNTGYSGSPTIFKLSGNGQMDFTSINSAAKMINLLDAASNQEKFVVYGNGKTHVGDNVQIGFSNSAIQDANTSLNINNVNQNGIKFNTYNNSVKLISIANPNFATSPFTVNGEGKTQIGGEFTTNSTYWLTVNGRMGAREIKVSIQNPWPDYVFNKNYKLQSLDAVEKYIKKHKHLPNIPSATELNKDELGLDLAKMQGKQMEKIEEIYLYLFEMKKEIEKLKEENAELKKELKK